MGFFYILCIVFKKYYYLSNLHWPLGPQGLIKVLYLLVNSQSKCLQIQNTTETSGKFRTLFHTGAPGSIMAQNQPKCGWMLSSHPQLNPKGTSPFYFWVCITSGKDSSLSPNSWNDLKRASENHMTLCWVVRKAMATRHTSGLKPTSTRANHLT